MSGLLPCPFCGGPAHSTPPVPQANLAALVMCSDDCCYVSGYTLHEAEAAWNRRAPDPLVGQLVEALERSLTAIDDWLNLYAPEHCDPARVAEARNRVGEHGALHYIAVTQEAARTALAAAAAAKVAGSAP